MWAKQHAWLSGSEKGKRHNRAARFIDEPPLPDLEGDEDLAVFFGEFGFVKAGAMGLVPLDWADLQAFSAAMGYIFTPWQAQTLISMSRDYATIANNDDPLPMPWQDEVIDRDNVASRLKGALNALKSRKRAAHG